MKPKVSIIIPCYNSEKWIEECILSALNQTYENVEVICVDNESTDESYKIIQKLKEDNPELIISTAPNIYPHCWDEAREEACKLLSGDYFTVMGSDDFLDKDYVFKCMEHILAAPDKILAFQSPILGVKDSTNEIVGEVKHFYYSLNEFKKMCLEKCPVNSPAVFFNSKLLEKDILKTKPELYGGAADYDMYCNLAENNVIIYPAPRWLGFYYRWHEEQATWKVQKEGKRYDQEIQDFWRNKWNLY